MRQWKRECYLCSATTAAVFLLWLPLLLLRPSTASLVPQIEGPPFEGHHHRHHHQRHPSSSPSPRPIVTTIAALQQHHHLTRRAVGFAFITTFGGGGGGGCDDLRHRRPPPIPPPTRSIHHHRRRVTTTTMMDDEMRMPPYRRRMSSTAEAPEGLPKTSTAFGPANENALIILNTDCVTTPLFRRFWSLSGLRICADGGANQLYDGLSPSERPAYVPNYIKGDLDSVRPEVAAYYETLGTHIIRDPDQDTNDLEKCLEVVKRGGGGKVSSVSSCNVFVVGALGLRFDHAMSNIHILFKYSMDFRRLFLLGTESMAFLLQPGSHTIRPDTEIEGPICGLLPISGKCQTVNTTGLRWNLHQQALQFGGLISTSNEFLPITSSSGGGGEGEGGGEVIVTVENSDPLVWTTAIKEEWQKKIPPSTL